MMHFADILRLPYSSDLTESGIAFAKRSLSRSTPRSDRHLYDHLRHTVAGAAVELAFRRHLTESRIPFKVKNAAAFSDPNRYDVSLGGHRCDLRSFLISRRNQIRDIHHDPGILLDAPALVPMDQDAGEGHHDEDIYLFAFATGLTTNTPTSLNKAIAAEQPIHLLHALPREWANPKMWTPLGPLALKSESASQITVELSGQIEDREFASERLLLPPLTRVPSQTPFFSISSIHVDGPPTGRVGIHSTARNETHVIQTGEWGNIWVYGMDLYLAGWISRV